MMDFLGNCTVFHSSVDGDGSVKSIWFVVVELLKEDNSKGLVFSTEKVQFRWL